MRVSECVCVCVCVLPRGRELARAVPKLVLLDLCAHAVSEPLPAGPVGDLAPRDRCVGYVVSRWVGG